MSDELRDVLRSARSKTLLRDLTTVERVALAIANNRHDIAVRRRWRDACRNALVMARLDRETAAKLRCLRMPDAARIASDDASDRERYAAELRRALDLFPHPPDFWTEPSRPDT